MGYRRCPDCGAYLDPDERCDCFMPAAKVSLEFDFEDAGFSQ